MASLKTSISQFVFPSEVSELVFEGSVGDSFQVLVGLDGFPVLDASLTILSSGHVTVENLDELLQTYLEDGELHDLTVAIDGETKLSGVKILSCRVDCQESAIEYCRHNFITLLKLSKVTYKGARELLSLYCENVELAKIRYYWQSQDGMSIEEDSLWTEVGLNTLDVSPPAKDDAKLVAYVVEVGMRTMEFCIYGDGDAPVTSVQFLNAFGQPETCHFFGTCEKETKPNRGSAVISGRMKTYHVEAIPAWKVVTRVFSEGEFDLLEDLVTSIRVERCSDGCPITITESEMKQSTNFYKQENITVSWREEKSVRRFIPKRRFKTFDKTFDDTFI